MHVFMSLMLAELNETSISWAVRLSWLENGYSRLFQRAILTEMTINGNKCKKLQFIQTLTATCSE